MSSLIFTTKLTKEPAAEFSNGNKWWYVNGEKVAIREVK
jgi:hypothetical protein